MSDRLRPALAYDIHVLMLSYDVFADFADLKLYH